YLGNLLELKALGKDDRFLFLSDAAYLSLRPEQRQRLQQHGQLVPVPVPTIEAVGGGSVRCMLAENFLEPLSE
ncbi:MAG: amidinotransferase, partial [Flavobacteriales bacterium]|nr:amidinotransferase [Flavobacteriales bacterium]